LLRACAEEHSLELDLTELVSADMTGIDALQRIRGAGAALTGAPGYIQMKLDSAAGGPGVRCRKAARRADPRSRRPCPGSCNVSRMTVRSTAAFLVLALLALGHSPHHDQRVNHGYGSASDYMMRPGGTSS
jgi:hypothetical protein